MMRADALNFNGYPVRTEITYPSSHVCYTDEDESKGIIVHNLYCVVVLRTRTNQKASSSTKLYRRAVPQTRTNYVLRKKTNQNALIRKNRRKE